MYKFYLIFFNIFFCLCFSQDANHLIFKRVCTAPNEAEMIEIFNPTSVDINLNAPGNGSYFLTDGTDPTQSEYYYNIVTSQSAAWSGNITTDFFISFPVLSYFVSSRLAPSRLVQCRGPVSSRLVSWCLASSRVRFSVTRQGFLTRH